VENDENETEFHLNVESGMLDSSAMLSTSETRRERDVARDVARDGARRDDEKVLSAGTMCEV
jgi:hypothetical protein